MRFAIVSNLNNGVGLQRDYELLRAELEKLGHTVEGIQFNGTAAAPDVDITIFLEVVAAQYFGRRNWIVPNLEWWFREWDAELPRFELVLSKTNHCQQAFSKKVGTRAQFIGWKSRDLYRPEIAREKKFLHVAGKSQTKNTNALILAWRKHGAPGHLTIVSQHYKAMHPRIKVLRHVANDELIRLMNSHQFHLMPSAYEGWGHSLHEGMGVGGVILTTDAEPMCDWGNILIRTGSHGMHHGAPVHQVSPADVAHVTHIASRMTRDAVKEQSAASRLGFLAESLAFNERIKELVGCA